MAKGLGALADSANKAGGTQFLKLKDGESIVMRILHPVEELITVNEHVLELTPGNWRTYTCLCEEGLACPLCEMGDKAKPATYIPFYGVADGKIGIFKASPTVAATVLAIVEEYGDITARDFKLSRKGLKFDTKYIFLPKDKDQSIPFPTGIEIPNIEKMTACKSAEQIRAEVAGVTFEAPSNESSGDSAVGAKETGSESPAGGAPYPF